MSHTESCKQNISRIDIPLWVKSIFFIGFCLFISQLVGFRSVLSDSIVKDKAEKAYSNKNYPLAIASYKDLLTRYPENKAFIKDLGISLYREGLHTEALMTLYRLEGVKMPKSDVKVIDEAISDMLRRN